MKYLDESCSCLWSPVSYSYSRIDEQKRLEQTERWGRRISILGLWQPEKSFEYALACGSFKSASYIKVMDWMAIVNSWNDGVFRDFDDDWTGSSLGDRRTEKQRV